MRSKVSAAERGARGSRGSGAEPQASEQQAARERCLRLLGMRPRSAAELRERLLRAHFGEEVIAQVLSGLERAGLVDDEEFARSWVDARQGSRGVGREKLRWELRRKGISEELIRRAVDDQIDDEAEVRRAMQLVRRRLGDRAVGPGDIPRLARFLNGRGFGREIVDDVVKSIAKELER